jgi:hypothetical protein
MELRRLALYLTRTRVGLGLLLLVAPRVAVRRTYGVRRDEATSAALTRMLGAREVALGAGGAIAVGERRGSAGWVSMIALADGLDAVANLTGRRLGWRGRVVGVVAAGSAVGHLVLAKRLAADLDG